MRQAALFLVVLLPSCEPRGLQAAITGKARTDIIAIDSALDDWANFNGGAYPESLDSLWLPDKNGETFLDEPGLMPDPWGREYLYDPPRAGESRPRIYTLGKDGQPGGTGPDADVDNWSLKDRR